MVLHQNVDAMSSDHSCVAAEQRSQSMKRLVPHDRELVTKGQPSLRKSFFISNPLVGLDREAEIQLGSGPDNDRFSFGVKRQTSVNLAHVEQLCVVAGRRLGFRQVV